MNKLTFLDLLSGLFDFKVIRDEDNNEYVLFKHSKLERVDHIIDKTEFEAVENHIHICDRIRKEDFSLLLIIANRLGKALLNCLKANFPLKEFVVFVTLSDSMIIRFHQKWGDEYYYNLIDLDSNEFKIVMFE